MQSSIEVIPSWSSNCGQNRNAISRIIVSIIWRWWSDRNFALWHDFLACFCKLLRNESETVYVKNKTDICWLLKYSAFVESHKITFSPSPQSFWMGCTRTLEKSSNDILNSCTELEPGDLSPLFICNTVSCLNSSPNLLTRCFKQPGLFSYLSENRWPCLAWSVGGILPGSQADKASLD